MEELARQLPATWMNLVFFGTGWAPDADLYAMELDSWANFDDRAANVGDAPWIPNGNYELRFGRPEIFFEIKVYTVQSGNLRGRRVLKFKNGSTGRWKAFATLRRNGSIFVWSAYRGEEHREMVVAANFAFMNLARSSREHLVSRSVEGTRSAFSAYRYGSAEGAAHHPDLGYVRLAVHRSDYACQLCNNQTHNGRSICDDHMQDPDEAVPPHSGTFRSAGPADYLLSENGTGLVR